MPDNEKLKFEIEVDDNGTIKVRRFKRTVEDTKRSGEKFGRSAVGIGKKLGGLALSAGTAVLKVAALGAAVVTAAGAFAAWKIKQLAAGFLETGSSVEKMRLSLDTITKGEGEAWFKRLNEWALKMPINTAKAIESFTMMRAMGLKPSIADMTTLVDTTSALGGSEDTLEGIARALGQIQAKGKVSAEELMQLAERGVPATEILREKLGLTAEQVANIGNAGVKSETAIKALLEGMAERFGGQSEKMQGTWAGMMESLKSYWTDFKRMVMESGVMEWLEENLKAIVDWVDYLYQSGQLQAWAQDVAEWVVGAFEKIKVWVTDAIGSWDELEKKIVNFFREVKRWIELVTPLVKGFLAAVEFGVKTYNYFAAGNATATDNATAALSVGEGGIPNGSRQSGTGPMGLPYTGMFYGHKGEIVKNPAESDAERRGAQSGGGNNYHLHVQYMTGDRESIATAYRDMQNHGRRWQLEPA